MNNPFEFIEKKIFKFIEHYHITSMSRSTKESIAIHHIIKENIKYADIRAKYYKIITTAANHAEAKICEKNSILPHTSLR